MRLSTEPFSEPLDPNVFIESIWAGLGEAAGALRPAPCRAIDPSDLEEPFSSLLIHRQHMTFRLANHYTLPMRLTVLRSNRRDNLYTRLVQLVPREYATVVQHALIAVDLSLLPAPTGRDILRGDRPVGEVLVRHAVHTHVAPRWFVQIDPQLRRPTQPNVPRAIPAAARWGQPTGGRTFFGRVGRIFCDGAAAIRMFEIATGERREDLEPSQEVANPLGQLAHAG